MPQPNCSCGEAPATFPLVRCHLFSLSNPINSLVMNTTSELIRGLAGRLMRHPAAPYHEHAPRAEVERICAEHRLPFEQDRFGNVLVRLRRAPRQRPLVLAAHLDHPGFEILRPLSATRWLARFRGGAPDAYFRPGVPVRLMPAGIFAKLGRRQGFGKTFEILASQSCFIGPGLVASGFADFAV